MSNKNAVSLVPPQTDTDFLIRLNVMLASGYEFRKNIDHALCLIGRHIGYDRVSIIEIHPNMTFSVMHEWCNAHTPSLRENIRRHAIIYEPALEQQLCRESYITLDETEIYTPALQNLLKEYGERKVILFPLFESGSQFAFMGFSQCLSKRSWEDEEIRRLEGLAAIVASNMDKALLISRLLRKAFPSK